MTTTRHYNHVGREFDLRLFGRGGLAGFLIGQFKSDAAGSLSVFAWPMAYALGQQHEAVFLRPMWGEEK